MKYTELTPDEKTRYGQLFDQQLAAKGFVNPTFFIFNRMLPFFIEDWCSCLKYVKASIKTVDHRSRHG